jgi:hypothetical protein
MTMAAFRDDTALEIIILPATTPPTLGTNTFADASTTYRVYVPAGSVSSYQSAWNGQVFAAGNIVADSTLTDLPAGW